MNKRLIIFLLASLFSIPALILAKNEKEPQEENSIKWLTIEEAQQLGKANPKKVFVDVYTDWCGWCKVMDKNTFADPEIAKYVNEHYYAVKLNAEGSKKLIFNGQQFSEAELAKAFRVSGYPTVVFISEDFTQLTPVPGYQKAKEFKEMLVKFQASR